MKEINIFDIKGFRIGQTENQEAGTGVTVIVPDSPACCGLDVRGGGPASRESELLKPLAHAEFIHAVILGGGSAFGLDAAGGVMEALEKRGIGFPVGPVYVPLVCQSDIFDLTYKSASIRPDKTMGYEACEAAFSGNRGNYRDGSFGAGCGATVGKLIDMDMSMKSGIGSAALQVGDLKVGAVVAVNAIGDVYDFESGKKLAGHHKIIDGIDSMDIDPIELMCKGYIEAAVPTNTTIGIIITNAKLDKSRLCKVAGMAHDGYARCIRPIHTSMDGDSIYSMSVGEVEAQYDLVGTLANEAMCRAIRNSILNCNNK